MKWRECRNRDSWYTGPDEGRTYFQARKGGVTYTVHANWRDPLARKGDVLWWLLDGKNNRAFATKEAAIAAAEARATAMTDTARVRRAAMTPTREDVERLMQESLPGR